MKNISAEIITIGNELLAGYTVNTNATYISQQLLTIGISVGWVTTIRDDGDEILKALETSSERADLVLISGGLGPTPDDVTKQSICTFFDTEMVIDNNVFEDIKTLLRGRNLHLLESNRNQALVPKAATVIRNPIGTAPGLLLEKNSVVFIFMPGVPQELRYLVSGPVIEHIQSRLQVVPIHTHLLRTTGITEAGLYERIKDIVDAETKIQVSFLPRGIGVDLRLKRSAPEEIPNSEFTGFIGRLKERIGKYIFTENDITMQEFIGNLMKERSATLAVAESFTGGLISDWLTNVPGSSGYYLGGMVTYSNKSKMELLGVKEATLRTHGAVSEETVLEMVHGVCNRFQSNCAIATTGIAGPSGGTKEKPVGLCYVAARYGDRERSRKFNFGNNRLRTKSRGAMASLELLRRLILGID